MSWNVTVLTPNGRRYASKYSADTTLLCILEQTCTKYQFKPEEYDLTHHNRVLDLTLNLRFSGLPNNTLLEMAPSKKARIETEVTLGLQLENGDRKMGTFKPSLSIYEIISTLVPDQCDVSLNPVVIYMRKEIYGIEQLKETTLKSLGLTGGRAILRLLHRTPQQLKMQANVSAPLPQKAKEQEDITFLRTSDYENTPKDGPKQPDISIRMVDDNATGSKKICGPTTSCSEEEKNVNILENKISNRIEEIEKSSMEICSESNIPCESMNEQKVLEVLENVTDNVEFDEGSTEEIVILGERNALVFSQDMASNLPFDDLPDDFYNLTVTEVKKLFLELRKKREELENLTLKTSALRNAELDEKLSSKMLQNAKVVLRIHFPDRTVLQGTFAPNDNIQTVKEFVKLYLQNDLQEFDLYVTPPKQILSADMSLFDCECVPSAILYFGPHNVDLSMTSNVQYLKDEILTKLSTPRAAFTSASQSRGIVNTKLVSSVNRENSKEKAVTEAYQSVSVPGPSKEKNSNVPKWFKPNSK